MEPRGLVLESGGLLCKNPEVFTFRLGIHKNLEFTGIQSFRELGSPFENSEVLFCNNSEFFTLRSEILRNLGVHRNSEFWFCRDCILSP